MLKQKELKIKRYPASTNRSLQAWSAVDEYLISEAKNIDLSAANTVIYNDSFGYLTCNIGDVKRFVVCDSNNQQGAIQKNVSENKLKSDSITFLNPLEKTPRKSKIGLMKVPKSLELFELYLSHFASNASVNGKLFAGFMTRHFSKKMVEIAQKYFEVVEQSLAKKKARLLLLEKPKQGVNYTLINTIEYKDQTLSQHYGVFSASKIDLATQFLIEKMVINSSHMNLMDLACGNGIIGLMMAQQRPDAVVTLVDDSYLAIESAKQNVKGDNVRFFHESTLDVFSDDSFDFIATNPPFHQEHEIDISIPIRMFKNALRCLKTGGQFQVVANQHLNYKTHLAKLFARVETLAENEDYIVYDCIK